MIEFEEMRQLLCRACCGLRERVVATADEWIEEEGEFLAFPWMNQLCGLVVDRFQSSDYDQSDALFSIVERLLSTGDEAVQTVVATGFLEGPQHQRKLATELWRPLLGPLARSYCEAMDKFYGITP
ncbi:DUF7674 family protein [Pseudoduganella violaceinigra]|uniref:DUF7674 family protein n=1 Tax=Pseudoduganella violaceinigra TaxID=246602 RepID=UPI0004870EA2|nr:hypothetical protein [Pseudoduganella violaceinigra]